MRRLLTAIAFVLAATSCAADGADPAITSVPAGEDGIPAGEVVAIQAVLDGDSLAVERNGQRTEVRLAGINAPEADECHGDAARSALAGIIGDGPVTLVPVAGEDDEDQFGRLLRNVWSGDTWVNEAMVDQGHALGLHTGTGDEEVLLAASERAWQGRLGMWDDGVCGGSVPGIEIGDVRFDPPGRDRDNAVEEFVLVTNAGEGPVAVGGWIVRDESSQHRYRFPELTLEPGDGVRVRSGCGADEGRDLYWCAGDAVWSNGGDTVILQTGGGSVVDRLTYAGDF